MKGIVLDWLVNTVLLFFFYKGYMFLSLGLDIFVLPTIKVARVQKNRKSLKPELG